MYLVFLVFSFAIYPLTFLFPNDPKLIAWKITYYYGLFGILLLLSRQFTKKGLIGLVRSSGVDAPRVIWLKVDIYYSIVFIVLAIINSWFVLFMSTDQWVNFRLFVPFPALVVYTVIVSMLVNKDIINHEKGIA